MFRKLPVLNTPDVVPAVGKITDSPVIETPRSIGRMPKNKATGEIKTPLLNKRPNYTEGVPIELMVNKTAAGGKFEDLTCADAELKVETSIKSDLPKYRSAYEIVGFKQHDYKTSDPELYKSQLKRMNLADLQEAALANGFLPSDNRDRLIDRLMGKFREDTSGSKLMAEKVNHMKHITENPELLKSTLDILSRGRNTY